MVGKIDVRDTIFIVPGRIHLRSLTTVIDYWQGDRRVKVSVKLLNFTLYGNEKYLYESAVCLSVKIITDKI